MTAASRKRQWIKIRSVALPSEHGGWGFLIEPVLLGLLLAPSWAGAAFSAAALAAFLTHQPLKVTIKDWRSGRSGQRTRYARRFTLAYGFLAVLAMGWVLHLAPLDELVPLLVATPFVLTQIVFDARNKSREAIAEISGAVALGAIAPTLALLDGWRLEPAFALWALLLARSIPSILYIRARLRLEHNTPFEPLIPWLAHAVGLTLVLVLVLFELGPWLVINGSVLLMIRALWGLSTRRRRMRVALIGVQELCLGLVYVGLIAGGYTMIL